MTTSVPEKGGSDVRVHPHHPRPALVTQVQVLFRDGAHRCYRTTTGIDRTEVGCAHRVPRSAIDHADALTARSALDSTLQTAADEDSRARSEPPDRDVIRADARSAPGGSPLPAGPSPRPVGSLMLFDLPESPRAR